MFNFDVLRKNEISFRKSKKNIANFELLNSIVDDDAK